MTLLLYLCITIPRGSHTTPQAAKQHLAAPTLIAPAAPAHFIRRGRVSICIVFASLETGFCSCSNTLWQGWRWIGWELKSSTEFRATCGRGASCAGALRECTGHLLVHPQQLQLLCAGQLPGTRYAWLSAGGGPGEGWERGGGKWVGRAAEGEGRAGRREGWGLGTALRRGCGNGTEAGRAGRGAARRGCWRRLPVAAPAPRPPRRWGQQPPAPRPGFVCRLSSPAAPRGPRVFHVTPQHTTIPVLTLLVSNAPFCVGEVGGGRRRSRASAAAQHNTTRPQQHLTRG